MKKILFLIVFIVNIQLLFAQDNGVNMLSLSAGAKLLESPASYAVTKTTANKIEPNSAEAIHDQNGANGWCSQANHKGDFVFLFELSEEYLLEELMFNNNCMTSYPGISTKDIKVEGSVTSSEKGFRIIGNYTLKEKDNNRFTVKPTRVRWLKFTVTSNYGHKVYTQLMEIEAIGKYADYWINEVNLQGTWKTNWDNVYLKQNEQGYIYGCYVFNNGKLDVGYIKRRVYEFSWDEAPLGKSGWALLTLNKEGTKLRGIWGFGTDRATFGIWEFTYQNNKVIDCPLDSFYIAKKPLSYNLLRAEQKKASASPQVMLKMNFIDAETSLPIKANYNLTYLEHKLENGRGTSDETGRAQIHVSMNENINIKINAVGYSSLDETFAIKNYNAGPEMITTYRLRKMKVGQNIVMQNVLFKQAQAVLVDSSYLELDGLVDFLKENPGVEIELSGHTDNRGDAQANLELSEKRVETIKKYLVAKGIKETRISGKGYGGSMPIADNDDEKMRKLNRRVEFKIVKY